MAEDKPQVPTAEMDSSHSQGAEKQIAAVQASTETNMSIAENPTLRPAREAVSSTELKQEIEKKASASPCASSMLNSETNSSHSFSQEGQHITLDQLPSEILLHICSFLDAKLVITTFALICQHFHQLVSDDIFWKVRIKKRWPKKYPAIPVIDAEFNWKAACMEREEQYRRWINPQETMDYFRFQEGIFAPVDSVQLMQGATRLAIGSRDRYLNLLDLTKLDGDDPVGSVKNARIFTKMDAHKGWIWSMASLDGLLATGSWDMFIKFWDMEAEGQEIRSVKCKSAVLSMHYEPDFMVAGAFDKKVYHIDPRAASVIAEKRYHRKPVLSVKATDKYIMTGSEDSTLVIYDKRADKVYKTLEFADFPMSMSYYDNQLWIGDKGGLVHLVDATDGDFDIVETYNVGHRGKVTGIQYTPGALFTCSTDCTVRVHEPNADPSTITTLTGHLAEVASINYSNGVLVSGCSDVTVGIWKPKSPST